MKTMLLLIIAGSLCAQYGLAAPISPSSSEPHAFGSATTNQDAVTSVYVKMGSAMVWYFYGGELDTPQPMAEGAFLELADGTPNFAEGVTVICDDKVVFHALAEIDSCIPREIIESMANAKVTNIIFQMDSSRRTETRSQMLDQVDKENLKQFLGWGKDYKPATSPWAITGRVTYGIIKSPGMTDHLAAVKDALSEVVDHSSIAAFALNFVSVDSDVHIRPRRDNFYLHTEGEKPEILDAIRSIAMGPRAVLDSKQGHDLAGLTDDRCDTSLVIIAADDLPPVFLRNVYDQAHRWGTRVSILWVGDEKAGVDAETHMRWLVKSTGGMYFHSLHPEEPTTQPVTQPSTRPSSDVK